MPSNTAKGQPLQGCPYCINENPAIVAGFKRVLPMSRTELDERIVWRGYFYILPPPCECPTKMLCIFAGTLCKGGIKGGSSKSREQSLSHFVTAPFAQGSLGSGAPARPYFLPSLCKGGCRAERGGRVVKVGAARARQPFRLAFGNPPPLVQGRREKRKASPWGEAPPKAVMRGTAKEQSLCLTPHPSLRDTRLGGARSDAASGHDFCLQWQKPQFVTRAHHTVVMRITRGSPPRGKA